MRNLKSIWVVCLAVSVAAITAWSATGRDWYTKFQVVEVREMAVDPDDPFAGTGLYDGTTKTEVESRDEFRLGLLPAGGGKYLISVSTIVLPPWAALVALWLLGLRRRQSRMPNQPSRRMNR
ncbi:MAG TPA: hypothetical protein VLV83_23785 [Acidobacteriota bacterium]|nr:hypothetical protein [Acidobacteriota bacterium]